MKIKRNNGIEERNQKTGLIKSQRSADRIADAIRDLPSQDRTVANAHAKTGISEPHIRKLKKRFPALGSLFFQKPKREEKSSAIRVRDLENDLIALLKIIQDLRQEIAKLKGIIKSQQSLPKAA
ncbi:hypothetical protein ACFSM5_21205 [Lacibacterium aquatile]|uniref:Transposase n=1 Tax=Lacibacterium aquatile TaxID=1168082 RepID=A0ABW5DYA6_9PROT